MDAVESHFASNSSQVRNSATATLEEMSLTVLIPIACAIPWAAAATWAFVRSGLRPAEVSTSFVENARQRLTVR
jgi:Sec-independent protein secretion pathway component TatC